MTVKTVKVTVHLPIETYRHVEKRRKELRLSRSAVISKALECCFATEHEQEKISTDVSGYQQFPKTERERRKTIRGSIELGEEG